MKNLLLVLLAVILFFNDSIAQNRKFTKVAKASLRQAIEQYLLMDATLQPDEFPRNVKDDKLVTNKASWWTSGFYPGTAWYLYKFSKDERVKNIAVKRTATVEKESLNTSDHDIGFKIWCSYGNQLRFTNDSSNNKIIINAANSLSKRFSKKVQQIRSWGNINDTTKFTVIIDNMMNLELLFEATRITGDSGYYKIATTHADKTLANHFWSDGSSYHVVEYNAQTGNVISRHTAQGFSDSSAWARGQAWALYGYTMCYRYTKNNSYLEQANKIADFILHHPNLPKDKIPYWDFNAVGIPNTYRDASAAAIIASALLELSRYNKSGSIYYDAAYAMLLNLSKPAYRNSLHENHNFLLKHSVGHLPAKSEVDTPLSYADYYYVEALMRYLEYKK